MIARHPAAPFAAACRHRDGAAVGVASVQPARAAEPAQAFEAALVEYERNHWAGRLCGLRAAGRPRAPGAARVALQMWRYGPVLYGRRFDATPYQQLRWSWLQRWW